MAKRYTKTFRIRHGHTDPAGIVFYPRYYELISATVEDFFAEALGLPFGDLHTRQRLGIPTVNIETTFLKPSYCDEALEFSLVVLKLGRTSATFGIEAQKDGELRLTSKHTIANVALDEMRPEPFSPDVRERFAEYLVGKDVNA